MDGLVFEVDPICIQLAGEDGCPIGDQLYKITGNSFIRCEVSGDNNAEVYCGNTGEVYSIEPEAIAHGLVMAQFDRAWDYMMDETEATIPADEDYDDEMDRLRQEYFKDIVEKYNGTKFTLRKKQ